MTDRDLLELLLKKVTGLENEVTGLGNKVTGIENRVTGIENKISVIDKKVNFIENNMVTKEDIAEMSEMKTAIFETAEIVKHIEKTQEKHERTLDLLSRRSIDQEAELKRIK